jgi:hypothetical protein
MKMFPLALIALTAGQACGQITLTSHSYGGFWSIGEPGSFVSDSVNLSGPGGLNYSNETRYDSGILSAIFTQTITTEVTPDSVTFRGSLKVREFFTILPNITPDLFSTEQHMLGGQIRFDFPAEVPVRVTGTLRHEPMIFPEFGEPILLNGTVMSLGSAGVLRANPFGSPALSTVDTIDTTLNLSSGLIDFDVNHLGGPVSPLGLSNTTWEVTFQIVPAPGSAALIAPFVLLASRRRR